MKRIFYSISILLSFLNHSIGQCSWASVGPTDSTTFYGNYGATDVISSLAISKSHNVCLAFSNANNGGKAAVLRYNGSNWSFLGGNGFSPGSINTPSLAFSANDTAYLAYSDGAYANRASVMKFNGTSWTSVGTPGFSGKSAKYTSLVLNSKGQLFLAYQDSINATVVTYNGSTWIPLGAPDFSPGKASFINLKISKADTLFIAYVDNSDTNRITVMKFNGTNWIPVGKVDFSAKNTTYSLSLALDSAGIPYVAYDDGGRSNKLTVMKFNGAVWDSIGNRGMTASYYYVQASSLTIDKTGKPLIAYSLYDGYTSGYPVVSRYSGTSWVSLTTNDISNSGWGEMSLGNYPNIAVDDSSSAIYWSNADRRNCNAVFMYNSLYWVNITVPSISPSYVQHNQLSINSKGVLYVSYLDGADSDKLTVRTFNGSNWVNLGNQGFSKGAVGGNCVAFGANDTVYIAYVDVAYSNKITVQKFNGVSWQVVGTPGFTTGPIYNLVLSQDEPQQGLVSMIIDKSGAPCVCYADANSGYATVMRFNGTSWVNIGTGYKGTGCILKKDSNDSLYVAVVSSNSACVVERSGSSWTYLGSPNFSPGGTNANLFNFTIATNNTPYVGYGQYPGLFKFVVKYYNGTNWVFAGDTTNITSGGCGVYMPFLTTDSHSVPYLSFLGYSGCAIDHTPLKFVGGNWVTVNVPFYESKTGYVETGLNELLFGPADTAYLEYGAFGEYVKKSICPILTSEPLLYSSSENSVYVLPNPNHGEFTVQIHSSSVSNKLEIYNMLGESVFKTFLNEEKNLVNIVNRPNGVYLYRVSTKEGKLLGSGKIILQ